jgi:uncharacterized membrane protein YcaP (DUF421 family)
MSQIHAQGAATVLYFYSLFILRTLGKRSAGDLTVVDVVVIVALDSAVGDPMFYPAVPLLHGIVVITLIVGLQRLGSYWGNRDEKLDQFLKGRPYLVVVNGIFDLDGLDNASISKGEIFQMARQHGYKNLGQIQRMYIETDDKPSIFAFAAGQARPGLQFEPPWELHSLHRAASHSRQEACSKNHPFLRVQTAGRHPGLKRVTNCRSALAVIKPCGAMQSRLSGYPCLKLRTTPLKLYSIQTIIFNKTNASQIMENQ